VKTIWGRSFLVLCVVYAVGMGAMTPEADGQKGWRPDRIRNRQRVLRDGIQRCNRSVCHGVAGKQPCDELFFVMTQIGLLSSYRLSVSEHYDTPLETVVEHGNAATVAGILDRLQERIYDEEKVSLLVNLQGWRVRIPPNMYTLFKEKSGKMLLEHAVHKSAYDVVALFFERCPRSLYIPDMIFHKAIASGCAEAVRVMLLSARFSPLTKDEQGATAFHVAAKNGRSITLRILYRAYPSDVLAQTDEGNTVLHEAVLADHVKTAQYILSGSFDPCINERNRAGRTPLEEAVSRGNNAMVSLLLADQRLSLYDSELFSRKNLLHDAAERGHAEIVRILLANRLFDPSSGDCMGRTPLHEAAEQGHAAVVRELLADARCDVMIETTWGDTAAALARDAGHFDIARAIEDTIIRKQSPDCSVKRLRVS